MQTGRCDPQLPEAEPASATAADVAELAARLGLSQATAYRLIKLFRAGGIILSLVDRKRGRPQGHRVPGDIRATVSGRSRSATLARKHSSRDPTLALLSTTMPNEVRPANCSPSSMIVVSALCAESGFTASSSSTSESFFLPTIPLLLLEGKPVPCFQAMQGVFARSRSFPPQREVLLAEDRGLDSALIHRAFGPTVFVRNDSNCSLPVATTFACLPYSATRGGKHGTVLLGGDCDAALQPDGIWYGANSRQNT
ncbi:helix-turn-helix domain-containing protein [Mesorhizobium sp. M1169]|uniref:helix-turn-helix domain-containing protein n=1 Tax=Mesorhizobium sp. M1169 TaxID=2957066 RepID=UPI00333C267F